MRTTFDAVVIGAGRVGLPIAVELGRKGWRVGVVERAHSVGRGQNRAAIGGIRATHSDPAKIAICRKSIEIVERMRLDHGLDVDWMQGGYLFPVYDAGGEAALRSVLSVQQAHGLDIGWVSPDEVTRLAPGLNGDGLRGGTFSPGDGSASPLKLIEAYAELARAAGVEFRFDEQVTGFEVRDGFIDGIWTSGGDCLSAGWVIDAAGAHSRELGAMLGLDLPIFPDAHEAGITEPVQRFFEPMIVDMRPAEGSANYYFYQNREGQVVFCITPQPAVVGLDQDSTSVFLPQVVRRMVRLYPRLRHLRVRRIWRGLYPMTPDGRPVVGRVDGLGNLFLAVGMCGQGFMIGPGLAELVAEVLVDGEVDRHRSVLDRLSLHRAFAGQEVFR